MLRKIADSVIVITGASSGIGRATALAFAQQGAAVVVAARSEQQLRELASECERSGGQALAVPTDVSDENAVQGLARQAIESFGRLDVWVNNAAVTLFSRFEESPPEAYRRVIETNLFGCIYGARAALPCFREQGGGILINISSIAGKLGEPYTSAYVISKFGILGLSASLRQELRGTDIHVCSIVPASVDTPLFQHGANYTGRSIKPISPVYDPEEVAQVIINCASNPKREVIVGKTTRTVAKLHTLSPTMGERLMARQGEVDRFKDLPAPPSAGNLFQPAPPYGTVSGGWRSPGKAPIGRIAAAGIAAAALSASALLWLRPVVKKLLNSDGSPS